MRFEIKKIIASILNALGILNLLLKLENIKYKNQYIRILNYHNTANHYILKQIKWLKKHYKNVSYDEFENFMNGIPLKGNKPGIMLTFDDGLYGNYHTAIEDLDYENVTGYFMISSDLIGNDGYMTEEQIKDLLARNHIIGCHTATHHRMNASDSEAKLNYEIVESKEKLEKMFGVPLDIFCWCGGEENTYTSEAQKVIEKAGYKYGFMTNSFPVIMNTDRFHIQRINVEDTWGISLLKFQICGCMDRRFKNKRRKVNEMTGGGRLEQ